MAIEVNTPQRLAYEPRRRTPRDSGGDDLDWLKLARTLWRRKLFLFGFLLIVLGLTAAAVSRMPPAFEAQSLVMLADRQAQVVDIPQVLSGLPPNEEGLQAQLLLIQSRDMAQRLADRLNLHLLPEFNPALRSEQRSLADWLDPTRLLPAVVLDRLPKAWADTLVTSTSPFPMSDQQKAALLRLEIVQRVLESIRAEPANRSTVIGLNFISTDPELAALGANTLAELYLDEQLEAKQSASTRAREFLEQEIRRLRASVAIGEQAIQQYRRQHGMIEEQPVDAQQLSELTTQLVLSRSQRAEAEARLRQVEALATSDLSLEAVAQMVESAVLTELRAREVGLNRELAELSSEYGDRHPRMISLRAEQASLEARKEAEIRQVVRRLREEVEVLQSREATLQANIGNLRGQLSQRNQAQIELGALQRDTESERDLLETYLNRVQEIASQQKAQEPDARVISRAVMPDEPAYPQRRLIFGIAFFGALFGGSLLVFGLESLDRTVRSSEQIEDLVGLPALGLVPLITDFDRETSTPEDYALNYPNSPFGEAVRSLRTTILLTSAGTPPNTVLMTSSIPGEGKTSMAMCLARISARAGRRTLIVDCDLRRPRLHELAGIENEAGLSDVLSGQCQLDEVMHPDEPSGAFFVTAGAPAPDPAAILASERMRQVLSEACGRFDLVILDSPPVLSVSDGRVLSQMVDKTIFLVHWGSTRRNDVMMGVKQLIEAGADVAGLVLSRVNVRKHATYGYRDSGYYYDDKYTKYYHAN